MSGILMMSVGNSYGSLPVNTVAPVVSGTAAAGQTLTTTDGTWTGAPAPTFTYQWQRGVTNIGGATSSTYVLQFADVGNTVRCVVTATNPLGAASANSNNTATVAAPVIGSAIGGGFYAGQISTTANSVATHYLVVGPQSTAQNSSLRWKNANTSTPGADSAINGPQNTADMVADGNSTVYPAAHFCNDLVIGGFDDWYMPSRNELEVCYFNLKPTTLSNSTSSGININAVPSRGSNYTSGTPAQTSSAAFQTGGAQAFTATDYWSSTEGSASNAWSIGFNVGDQNQYSKDSSVYVRAIRRIPV
jgi:hypothetical protein